MQQQKEGFETEELEKIESLQENIILEADKPIAEENISEQTQEVVEQDLNLDDMDYQLNPEAKEFVPTSPVSGRANDFHSTPPENGTKSPFIVNQILSNFDDAVVAQSPRKGDILLMEDVAVPSEKEFDLEADARPHEVNLLEENFQRIEPPSAKEAMQVDEKLEQGYMDDSQQQQQQQPPPQEQSFFEEEKQQESDEYKVLESSFDQYSNGFQSKIDDPMNRSFYEGRDNDILAAATSPDLLNTVQTIPSFEDEQPEADTQFSNHIETESDKPEADLAVAEEPDFVTSEIPQLSDPISQMIESSDNFEAEKFVEEIKGVSENKYDDTGLSPTLPVTTNSFQSSPDVIEETIVTHNSFKEDFSSSNAETIVVETINVDNLIAPELETTPLVADGGIQLSELKNIPEAIEIVKEVAKSEPKTEVAAAPSKKPLSAAKKPSPTATKAPAKPAEIKKTEVKPKTASATTKPAAVKAPASKLTSTVKPAPAPSAARPKPTTASLPPVKKPTTTSSISKTSTVTAKTVSKTETKPATAAKPTATASSVPPKRPASTFTAR